MFQAAAAAAARCGHVLKRLLTSYPPSHSSTCCCSLLSNAKCLSSRGDEAQHLIGYYDRSGQLVLKRMSGGLAERLWSAPVRIEHQIAREVFFWGGRGKEKFCTFNWNYSSFGFTISTGLAPVSVFVTLSPRFQWLPPTPVLLTAVCVLGNKHKQSYFNLL